MEHSFVSHSKLLQFVSIGGKLDVYTALTGRVLSTTSIEPGSSNTSPALLHAILHFIPVPLLSMPLRKMEGR
jgi:hypothetical protein